MTIKQGIEKINHFWPLVSAIGTCLVIVCGGVYASGVNVEKMRNDQAKVKESISAVGKEVHEVKKELGPMVKQVDSNKDADEKLLATCKRITDRVAEDKEQIQELAKKVQQIREEMSAMKTQQQADADWIKSSLQRIESKQ